MAALRSRPLTYGVGINDADYVTQKNEVYVDSDGNKKKRKVWACPFYKVWVDMLARGYSERVKSKYPTYADTTVCNEWHRFSTFKSWMEQQDWEGKELDKDILVPGNKVYNPVNCVFISQTVNKFVLESESTRGECPIGVFFHTRDRKFIAQISNPFSKKKEWLGAFDSPEAAHLTWLKRKLELAYLLGAEQGDQRISKALISRYENYSNEGLEYLRANNIEVIKI